jgi:hypothetical protein
MFLIKLKLGRGIGAVINEISDSQQGREALTTEVEGCVALEAVARQRLKLQQTCCSEL